MRHVSTTLCALMLLLAATACSKYHTRLFQPTESDVYIERYKLVPRVVAYRNARTSKVDVDSHEYWASLRIEDTSIVVGDFTDAEFQVRRNQEAYTYLGRVLNQLRVDSIAIETGGGSFLRIVAVVDSARHTPRDVNYMTYNFGQIHIPPDCQEARAVAYYRWFDDEGRQTDAGEIEIPLVRVESHSSTFQDLISNDEGGFRGNQ